jgi:hypothetical protein
MRGEHENRITDNDENMAATTEAVVAFRCEAGSCGAGDKEVV